MKRNSWLETNCLTDEEKSCKNCSLTFLGDEVLNIKDDGNVKIKYVVCLRCGTALVLDVDRSEN